MPIIHLKANLIINLCIKNQPQILFYIVMKQVGAMKKLSKKQAQWAWFIGLYLAGFLVVFTIAQLIRLAMGV